MLMEMSSLLNFFETAGSGEVCCLTSTSTDHKVVFCQRWFSNLFGLVNGLIYRYFKVLRGGAEN
jgi:hypothetical protein